ncbi:sigma-70 family RNA polymerase sigma factor [Streptosporangium canum]|uniref:sigma-70 family RNA polymerase sigma factor n=1 Tax=Streptosporangium canum TaxID=324952 RepID=UPI0036C129AD
MQEEIRRLRKVEDPAARGQQAGQLLLKYQEAVLELSRIRREAIEELTRQGMKQTQIAEALGVSRGRVSQLASSGPPPERAFLGDGQVTVAVGGKQEADKADPCPVIAQEDLHAYVALHDLCASVKLEAIHEVIQPPGLVDLNRDNLVVICGPRLSPLISQILAVDHNLAFQNDDQGWHLVDQQTGITYRSPMSSGQSGDIGYLARLPRPDRRGNFLYIAGIHAMGSAGVIHYLARHLNEIYRDVKTRRFSCLVECTFDPENLEVATSRLITPLYRFEAS